MFSFKKQIYQPNANATLLQANDVDEYDLYSINYTLKFENKEAKLSFQHSIAFYMCLDKVDNIISVTQDFIGTNHDTDNYIILNSQNNLKNITKLNTSSDSREVIRYKPCKTIQPLIDFSTVDIQTILSYIEKEIEYGYDEASLFFVSHNISTNDAQEDINKTFAEIKSFFKIHFNLDKLRENTTFQFAEILHNNQFLQNVIPITKTKNTLTNKF